LNFIIFFFVRLLALIGLSALLWFTFRTIQIILLYI
jgi:hypothetical protein